VGAENILVITFDRDHSASEAIGALTGLAADGRVELRRPRSSVGRATAGCRSAMRSAMWRPRGRWPSGTPGLPPCSWCSPGRSAPVRQLRHGGDGCAGRAVAGRGGAGARRACGSAGTDGGRRRGRRIRSGARRRGARGPERVARAASPRRCGGRTRRSTRGGGRSRRAGASGLARHLLGAGLTTQRSSLRCRDEHTPGHGLWPANATTTALRRARPRQTNPGRDHRGGNASGSFGRARDAAVAARGGQRQLDPQNGPLCPCAVERYPAAEGIRAVLEPDQTLLEPDQTRPG
jgi:hypothetical protein